MDSSKITHRADNVSLNRNFSEIRKIQIKKKTVLCSERGTLRWILTYFCTLSSGICVFFYG